MNLPTIFISLFIIAMFVLAIRHIIKKGTCNCGDKGTRHSGSSSCCTHCSQGKIKGLDKVKH